MTVANVIGADRRLLYSGSFAAAPAVASWRQTKRATQR